jgi:metallo-beta-lactamase family protein
MFAGYQAVGTLGRIIYDGAKEVKILGEAIDVKAEITLLSGISGHADQPGLLNWLDSFTKKPAAVFVNHGDDESCTGLARAITDRFGIPAYAPYSGSCFDLAAGEWYRLTDPVYKKEEKKKGGNTAPAVKKEQLYRELVQAGDNLMQRIRELEGHSNAEIKSLTGKIRSLMK